MDSVPATRLWFHRLIAIIHRFSRLIRRVAEYLLVIVLTIAGLTFVAAGYPATEQRPALKLQVSFQGSLVGRTYVAGANERSFAPLSITGATIESPGILTPAGSAGSVSWPLTGIGRQGLAQDVLTEIVVAPDALDSGGTLIDLGGAVRLEAVNEHQVRLSAGPATNLFTLPRPTLRNGLPIYHFGLLTSLRAGGAGHVSLLLPMGVLSSTFQVAGAVVSTPDLIFGRGLTAPIYGVSVTTGATRRDEQLGSLPCTAVDLDPAGSFPVTPGECASSLTSKASALRPTPRQLAWQGLEQTAFIHFGVNTFTDNEWGSGDEDPNVFQPTGLDTDQWARTLSDNGFRLVILTVKHHDGFLLYNSRYTDHDVGSSSWEGGRGDVVRSFVDSARRFGLKVGFYLSPADENQYRKGVYANGSKATSRTIPTLVDGDDRAGRGLPQFVYDATDYGAYFLNQLYELLTQYGPVDEVWFDGAQGHIPKEAYEDYAWGAFKSLVRRLAPQAVMAVSGADVRWVGNETGHARTNEWSPTVVNTQFGGLPMVLPSADTPNLGSDDDLYAAAQSLTYAGANPIRATDIMWYPAEVDVSIRPGWFFHPDQEPKSADELANIYYDSVGRNSGLLLNVPPDRFGRLPESDVARLAEWQSLLRQAMPTDLALGAMVSVGDVPAPALVDGDPSTSVRVPIGGSAQIDLRAAAAIDRIALAEDIGDGGQQVESYAVDAWEGNDWRQVATGGTIGYQRIQAFSEPVVSSRFRVRVETARAGPLLSRVSLYSAASSPVPAPTDVYLDCAATQPGPGTSEAPLGSLAQLGTVNLSASSTVHVRSGTVCAETLRLRGYGTAAAPARVVPWGDGPAPVLGAPGNARVATALRDRGWLFEGVSISDS